MKKSKKEFVQTRIVRKIKKEGTVMVFEKLKTIIAEVLNVDPDEITMDTTFMDDLGADSLDVYQIIMSRRIDSLRVQPWITAK